MAQAKGKASSKKKFRSDLAKLKRAGLIDVDVRTAAPSSSLKGKIRKYRDVIDGRATVVKARSAKAAKVAAGRAGFQHQGNRIIVPKHKGMRPKYEAGYVRASGTTFGEKIRQTYVKPSGVEDLPKPLAGYYYVYKVPFVQFDSFQQFSSYEEYAEFRGGYHRKGRYLDMDDQVVIELVKIPDDEEGPSHFFQDEPQQAFVKPKRKKRQGNR